MTSSSVPKLFNMLKTTFIFLRSLRDNLYSLKYKADLKIALRNNVVNKEIILKMKYSSANKNAIEEDPKVIIPTIIFIIR